MIDAELEPIATSIVTDHAQPHIDALSAELTDFINGQRRNLLSLAEQTEGQAEALDAQIGETGQSRLQMLKMARSVLAEYQDRTSPEEAL